MTDKELTFLSYLADALVGSPKQFRSLFKHAREFSEGEEYLCIVDCLEKKFRNQKPNTAEDVRTIMQLLNCSLIETESRAGHVLSWGIREYDWSPKRKKCHCK